MRQDMAVQVSCETVEWYTPPLIIELARLVMGGIDLDPASNDTAQQWIKATTYWTEGALERQWFGRVWLNPPYGKDGNDSQQGIWTRYMAMQYAEEFMQEGIALVNSSPGYDWYEWLWCEYPVCCLKERLRFIKPDGKEGGRAKKGQTLAYMGRNVDWFGDVYEEKGRILLPKRWL